MQRPRGEVPTDGGTIVGSGVSDTVYVPCSVDTEGSVHIQLSELTDKDIYIRRITLVGIYTYVYIRHNYLGRYIQRHLHTSQSP